MGDSDGYDASSWTERLDSEAFFEVVHESGDDAARWWNVSPNGNVMARVAAKRAGKHAVGTPSIRDGYQFVGRFRIELLMNPTNELSGGGLTQLTLRVSFVDCPLHCNVGTRLELKTTPGRFGLQLVEKGSLDVEWPRVVPFDEVAVIAVHQANQVREAPSACGMKSTAERRPRRSYRREQIGEPFGVAGELAGLDACRRF